MSEWKPIRDLDQTLHLMPTGQKGKVDLFSYGLNIKWVDCGWAEGDGCWVSTRKYVDDQGRRVTSFLRVVNPTHWMGSYGPPNPPDKPEPSPPLPS